MQAIYIPTWFEMGEKGMKHVTCLATMIIIDAGHSIKWLLKAHYSGLSTMKPSWKMLYLLAADIYSQWAIY